MVDPQWIMILVAIISPLAAWWGTFKHFSGKIQAWIDANDLWREEVAARLKALESHFRDTQSAIVATKVLALENEVLRVRKWRHERADPYISAIDGINKRVERIERILNGKL